MSKIVLVGNAPIDRELGKEIDSHEYVVRFNDYRIRGYESVVGEKTDIWVSCGDYADVNTAEFKEVWIPIAHNLHGVAFYQDVMRLFKGNDFENLTFIPKSFCDDVAKKVGYKHRWPSTGLIAIEWALKKFGEVDLAGFTFYAENVYLGISGTEHYFGNDDGFVYWAHSPKLEYQYGQSLRKDNRVIFL